MALDRIILLDENTANQIAAGEVVERPASVVKELVENAIDAEATQIVVSLEEGGKQRIIVADNGIGMSRNDAILAIQRHATSKIQSADDLFDIKTLGFRGEALPSIASVSRFEITTKPRDMESSTHVVVVGGNVETVEEAAARDGSTIEVAELFYNTPARLKFLKSTPSEVSRSVEVVGHLAIANPSIAFRLRHNNQEMFATPGSGEPLAAFASVWGRDIARKLIPIKSESPGLNVTGHIATPDVSRNSRSHELFYVNRRPIKSRLLSHALEDAYRSITPDSRYPIAAIFVEIAPELVDVNVHPTKTEVKFTRDGEVHHAVSQAVKAALLAFGIVPTVRVTIPMGQEPLPSSQTSLGLSASHRGQSGFSGFSPIESAIEAFSPFMSENLGLLDPFAAVLQFGESENPAQSDVDTGSEPQPGISPEEDSLTERKLPRPFAEQLREFRVIGQARSTYIIALTPDGIAVIDQHVAHERVLYERLTVKRLANGIPVQRLAVPLTLTLNRRDALLLSEHCESFTASGWEIAPFGGESFVVRSIPAMLSKKPYEKILRDMVDELVNQSISRRLLVMQEHVTITNACKMAVKAGDPLSIEEMTGLLEQLAETENPYLCPHGRPIVVTISFRDLDKQFKRA